ncbi:hypothetical protein NL676_035018 [Syzygium grande]|nr:hypothetical protein NL676_035018 [Syzygium grande]
MLDLSFLCVLNVGSLSRGWLKKLVPVGGSVIVESEGPFLFVLNLSFEHKHKRSGHSQASSSSDYHGQQLQRSSQRSRRQWAAMDEIRKNFSRSRRRSTATSKTMSSAIFSWRRR